MEPESPNPLKAGLCWLLQCSNMPLAVPFLGDEAASCCIKEDNISNKGWSLLAESVGGGAFRDNLLRGFGRNLPSQRRRGVLGSQPMKVISLESPQSLLLPCFFSYRNTCSSSVQGSNAEANIALPSLLLGLHCVASWSAGSTQNPPCLIHYLLEVF